MDLNLQKQNLKSVVSLMVWSFPEIRDELVLQFVSEPLSPPVPSAKTDSSPECDLDLDVTLEPKETPCEEEQKESGVEPVASQSQSMSEDIKKFSFSFFFYLCTVNEPFSGECV